MVFHSARPSNLSDRHSVSTPCMFAPRRLLYGCASFEERGPAVPIAAYFHTKNMTLEKFNEVHRRLDAAGAADPKGRIHHSCFGEDGDLMVFDIWERSEDFEAFGAVLMPIL